MSTSVSLGSGEFTYAPQEGWAQLPDGWSFKECADVAVDSNDRVYVFNRGEHPVIIFEADGSFVGSWGEGRLHHRSRHHLRPQRHHVHGRPEGPQRTTMHPRRTRRVPLSAYPTSLPPAGAATPLTNPPKWPFRPRTETCSSPTATATPASTSTAPTDSTCSHGEARVSTPGSSSSPTPSW